MIDNPYQSPIADPPENHTGRKLAALGIKVFSVLVGLYVSGAFVLGIDSEARASVISLEFGIPSTLVHIGFLIGIAATVAAVVWCFRIANAISPRDAQAQGSFESIATTFWRA